MSTNDWVNPQVSTSLADHIRAIENQIARSRALAAAEQTRLLLVPYDSVYVDYPFHGEN